MGFRDLLYHSLAARHSKSPEHRDERKMLKREIFKAFIGKVLEPKTAIEGCNICREEKQSKLEFLDSSLYNAVQKGDINSFNELTASKGWLGPRLENQASVQGNTVLHVAASSGHAEIVERILQCCFSLLTSENSDGDRPLHLAARGGHYSTVEAIIDCVKQSTASSSRDIESGGWDLKGFLALKNNAENNALHEALKEGLKEKNEALKERHERVAKLLIEQEPEIWGLSNEENKSPLYLAAEAGFIHLVNHIVNNSKQNQRAWLEGMSPAIAAIKARRTDILKAIMQLPAGSRGSTDKLDWNPFHYAASFGYVEGIVCLLGELGSTVDACKGDVYGLTPFHIAAMNGHVDVIKKLLEYCPYPEELRDEQRQNILHTAAKCGKENVVTYLLETPELKRLINSGDIEGLTPLHLATLSGHPKIVSILTKDKRIDMSAMTKGGYTALDIATQEVETKYSFRRRLTWIALRAADAPRGRARVKSSMVGSYNYNDRVNTLQVVATLIATVSFAAGFTLPGGYNSDDSDKGVATLLKKRMFQAYVICDTISLYSSIIVVVVLMWARLSGVYLMRYVLNLALRLLGLALTTMCLTFMTGVYVAVTKLTWIGVAVWVVGSICLVVILIVFVGLGFPHSSKYRIVRYMLYHVFLVLFSSVKVLLDDDDLEGASTAYSSR